MAKLNYGDSLGRLLADLGAETAYIIGDEGGELGIHWKAINAGEIDREITVHAPAETLLKRITYRYDKSETMASPAFSSVKGVEYILLSASFNGKEIEIKCNVAKGETCYIEIMSVRRLREILEVAQPNWFRLHLYNRQRP